MKHKTFLFQSLCLGILLICQHVKATDITSANAGFQFLDLPSMPRQVALGFTGTALGGSGFAFYNPASPMINGTNYLTLGYAPMPDEYSIAYAEGCVVLPNWFFAGHITNNFIDGIIPTTEQDVSANTTGSYDGTLVALNAGFIYNRLAVALTVNGMQDRIVTSTAYGISLSAGAVYLLTSKFTIGIAGMQLGTTTGYLDDTKKFGQGYALPRSARAGVAYCDTFRNVPFTATGDVVYRDVGTPSTPYSQRITSRTTIPLGIEIWPTSYVALRLGKRFNDDVNVFTCGAGLRLNALTFDLAFAFENIGGDKPDVEAWPFLSITYSLDKEKNTAAAVHSHAVQSGNF